MAKDTFNMMTFLANDPLVTVGAVGSFGFDYLANKSAYKEQKRAVEYREEIIKSNAAMEIAGIQVQTYLTQDALRAQASEAETNMMVHAAKDVNRAATEGATGENIALLYSVEEGKQARESAIAEAAIQQEGARGQLQIDNIRQSTQAEIDSMWSQLRGQKPTMLTSAVKTIGEVYSTYRSEATLRKKFDTYAGSFDTKTSPASNYTWGDLGEDITEGVTAAKDFVTGVIGK